MMHFNTIIRATVGADLSALAGFLSIQIKKLKSINHQKGTNLSWKKLHSEQDVFGVSKPSSAR
jgi:hypothetical protein